MHISNKTDKKRKIVVWGTGDKGAFFSNVTNQKIAYYIDSNKDKEGSLFFGKEIVHPDEITEWKECFVVVAVDNHTSIDDYLLSVGMKKNLDFIHYTKLSEGKEITRHNRDEVNNFFIELNKRDRHECLVFGAMTSFDPNSIKNLNYIYSLCKSNDFIVFSESMKINQQSVDGLVCFPYITLPPALMPAYYMSDLVPVDLPDDEYDHVDSIDYLNNAKKIMMARNPGLDISSATDLVLLYEQFIQKLLSEYRPKLIIMWNQFYPFHLVLDSMCKKLDITVLYLEHGVIPGTYALDKRGQMGESYVSYESKTFCDLPISDEDKAFAKDVWDYLIKSKINRNKQIPLDKEYLNTLCDYNRPVLFYAGQNDYESGLFPYTDRSKKYHSPAYLSSIDALDELAHVAQKNHWNLIYKPHPLVGVSRDILPANVILIEQGDINDLIDFADVTITILSQVGYASVIRKKPTIMLGYNQLRKKGCAYEAYNREELESVIKEALDNGFETEHAEAFTTHIAQLLNYYLFDNCSDRELRYGRSLETIKDHIVHNTLL